MSDAQGTGDRGTADRGLPDHDPPPAPLVRSPVLLDRWFQTARKLYQQGIQSPYVPGMLDQYGGVLSLASRDVEQVRSGAMVDGWIVDSRDPVAERAAAASRWAVHEGAMRSAIAAGTPYETAIRSYFDQAADTEPENLDQLTAMTTTQAPSYLWGWQTELEATKARFRRLAGAPHDMPIGYTLAAVAYLPNLPETPGELDGAQAADTVFGPMADALGAPGGEHATRQLRGPSSSYPSAARTVQEPPRPRVVGVEAPGSRPSGGGAAAGVVDDQARGLATPPVAPVTAPGPVEATATGRGPAPVTASGYDVGAGPGPVPGGEVRFVDGAPVFEQPMLGLIYDDGPTAASLGPPWQAKYKISKANNLLVMWNSRFHRVDPMPQAARARYGYRIPSDDAFRDVLRDYWMHKKLAQQRIPGGPWEVFDIALQQWIPEGASDRGHVMSCVEHHRMMVQRFGDDAVRTPADERLRKQLVRTFMRDPTNYLPQLRARNRGAPSPYTYEGSYPDFRVGGDSVTELPGGQRLRYPTPPP